MEHDASAAKPTGREARLADEVDDLTRALGEAGVELRALKRGGPRPRRGFAELEQFRIEGGLTVRRFCAVVGLPERTYYDRRARHRAGQSRVRGPWPRPARDGIRATVIAVALDSPMWGHRRKIAWLARHQHGIDVTEATCLRILREEGLTLPIDDVRERRDLAAGRREAFVEIRTRRNRVWQMDFL
ncbi:MAG: hypothetical protein ACSLFR_05565 [Solirubrobacteraceae bacterium]